MPLLAGTNCFVHAFTALPTCDVRLERFGITVQPVTVVTDLQEVRFPSAARLKVTTRCCARARRHTAVLSLILYLYYSCVCCIAERTDRPPAREGAPDTLEGDSDDGSPGGTRKRPASIPASPGSKHSYDFLRCFVHLCEAAAL